MTGDLHTCQVCPTQGAVLQARAAAGAVRPRHALAGAGCSLASTQATERVSTPPPHVALQGDHAPSWKCAWLQEGPWQLPDSCGPAQPSTFCAARAWSSSKDT